MNGFFLHAPMKFLYNDFNLRCCETYFTHLTYDRIHYILVFKSNKKCLWYFLLFYACICNFKRPHTSFRFLGSIFGQHFKWTKKKCIAMFECSQCFIEQTFWPTWSFFPLYLHITYLLCTLHNIFVFFFFTTGLFSYL